MTPMKPSGEDVIMLRREKDDRKEWVIAKLEGQSPLGITGNVGLTRLCNHIS